MPRSLRRDLAQLFLAGILALSALATYCSLRIVQEGERDERAEPVDAVVVMGAAVVDGLPSAVLRARLDHGIALFRAGSGRHLVLTGGREPGAPISEAEAARRYAEAAGVPATAVLLEATSHDTLSSIRSVAVLLREAGHSRALFVSDRSHMLRVLLIARDAGLTALGSPTPNGPRDLDPARRAQALLHELGAMSGYLFLGL